MIEEQTFGTVDRRARQRVDHDVDANVDGETTD